MICPLFQAAWLANRRVTEDTGIPKTPLVYAKCYEEDCQLWDAARKDCGLKQVAADPAVMDAAKKSFERLRKELDKALEETSPVIAEYIATSVIKKEGEPA